MKNLHHLMWHQLMSKRRVAILHFMPIEGYPPIQNLMRVIGESELHKTIVLTTKGKFPFKTNTEGVKIFRLGSSISTHLIKTITLWSTYLLFNVIGLIRLLLFKPHTILYYETISSLPALIYKRLFPNTRLLIHYHEYTSAIEYQNGSQINRHIHQFEKSFYPLATAISHTNEERMRRFCRDHGLTPDELFLIVPNYPPRSWALTVKSVSRATNPTKMVYVGYSIDNENMYIDELFSFIARNEEYTVDCYLFRTPQNMVEHAKKLSDRIHFHPSVEYHELPTILTQYQIGLILYRGTTDNYIYNAPNKLFEYMACGLDTWYPSVMTGIEPYKREDALPKVTPFNFKDIPDLTIQDKSKATDIKSDYFAESVYANYLKII